MKPVARRTTLILCIGALSLFFVNKALAQFGQPSANPAGGANGAASLSQYQFNVPPGWSGQQYPDGIVLSSQQSPTGERCQISMWTMRPSTGNLGNDVNAAFRDVFKAYELRDRDDMGSNVPVTVIRGTSGQGWDYVILKHAIGIPRNAQGTFATLLGSVMVANLNGNLAVVSTLSKMPLISSCLGELQHNAWPDFFYSLSFKNWNSAANPAVQQRLIGTWSAATATAADQFVFTQMGRYRGAAASQYYNGLANGEVLETTSAYFGNGAYALSGNFMTMTSDDKNTPPEKAFFRVEQESLDQGRTWSDALYLLRISKIDGQEYELRYKRTQ